MGKIIITLDGFSSCGKSTLARQLANELNYVFIDSGAMYRAITHYFLTHRIDWNHQEEVVSALKQITLDFQFNSSSGRSDMYLNHENVEVPIREMPVSDNVSAVSAVREVREFAVAQQQLMGNKKGIVMDGRDIGTTVFPHAELKIFVVADPAIRVERRYKEMFEKNPNITIEDVKNNLESRDYIDSHREVSPLRKADDAIELDNTNLTREEQLEVVLKWAKEMIVKAH
ncbi:MAG: (d)CMP kinase [Bacteroidetes bacterium]|nr:(d)CMP kinase [Bacteroidota bacterium]